MVAGFAQYATLNLKMYLSHTQLNHFLRCPRSYKFHYIDRKPLIVTGNIFAGRVYHEVIAAAYIRKLDGHDVTKEEIADTFSTFWDRAISEKSFRENEIQVDVVSIEWQDKEPGALKDMGITLAQNYVSQIMPSYKPVEVEVRKELLLDNITLVGYVDAICEKNSRRIIVDHKWREKKMSIKDLENDLQSTIYTMLTAIPSTEFHLALNLKNPKIEVQEVQRSSEDIEWVKVLISEIAKQIQAGLFPPTGIASWVCGIETCSFYTQCRMGW
jgi:CRISPR/Cas system-associated exonuclease Cas4 (RecB family)